MTTATLTRVGLAFVVDRAAFASAVTWAAKRVHPRPNIPAHGGILLTVADDTLEVAGFNENASATATTDVEGSDGKALVSGRLLADLLGTLPDKPIQAAVEGNSLALTCGRARVTLPLMEAGDFPALPEMPQVVGEMDAAVFAQAVRAVGISCDVTGEKSVASLAGINLRFGEALSVEASDRYRAAYVDIPWVARNTGGTALPNGAELLAVAADLAHESGPVYIGCTDTLLSLSTATRSVVIRQIGDPFHPNLRGLFPGVSPTPVRLAVADLKPTLDRVKLMAAAKDYPSIVIAPNEDSTAAVHGSGQDASTAEEIACTYAGPATQVTMSVRYLLAALGAVGTPEVDLTIGGRQLLLTPVRDEGDGRPVVHQMIAKMRS